MMKEHCPGPQPVLLLAFMLSQAARASLPGRRSCMLSRCCVLQEGSYRYRLTAWNAYGWSEDALSPVCLVNASSGVGGTGVSSAEDELHEQPEKADRGSQHCFSPKLLPEIRSCCARAFQARHSAEIWKPVMMLRQEPATQSPTAANDLSILETFAWGSISWPKFLRCIMTCRALCRWDAAVGHAGSVCPHCDGGGRCGALEGAEGCDDQAPRVQRVPQQPGCCNQG